MDIFHLTYHSKAASSITDQDILDILIESNTNNPQYGINGILLFEQGHFFHALEGSKREVLKLMKRIEQDPRHQEIEITLSQQGTRHYFSRWSMVCHCNDKQALPLQAKELRQFLADQNTQTLDQQIPAAIARSISIFKAEKNTAFTNY